MWHRLSSDFLATVAPWLCNCTTATPSGTALGTAAPTHEVDGEGRAAWQCQCAITAWTCSVDGAVDSTASMYGWSPQPSTGTKGGRGKRKGGQAPPLRLGQDCGGLLATADAHRQQRLESGAAMRLMQRERSVFGKFHALIKGTFAPVDDGGGGVRGGDGPDQRSDFVDRFKTHCGLAPALDRKTGYPRATAGDAQCHRSARKSYAHVVTKMLTGGWVGGCVSASE